MKLAADAIAAAYNLLWGDLFAIPLPGGGALEVSLLVLLLIPTGIFFTVRTRLSLQDVQNAGVAVAVPVGRLGEVAVVEVLHVADVGEGNPIAVPAHDVSWTSCLRSTAPSPRRSCGTTSSISWRPSCPPATSVTLKWLSTSDGLLVVLNIPVPGGQADLDVVVDVHALHHVHVEAVLVQLLFDRRDLAGLPHLPRHLVMERPHDALHAGDLLDIAEQMADYVMSFTEKYHMTFPGWEPERMAKLDELFEKYRPVTKGA